MSEAVNYLQVLSESLDKKIDILKQLEALTAAQKEIIDSMIMLTVKLPLLMNLKSWTQASRYCMTISKTR